MATTQGSQSTSGVVTAPRAARLWKLLRYLGTRPQTRSALLKRLGMDIRGFYRDLEFLRRAGIEVVLREGRYRLVEGEEKAEGRLPLPDPHLTVAEALQLATGRSRVHRRLRDALCAPAALEAGGLPRQRSAKTRGPDASAGVRPARILPRSPTSAGRRHWHRRGQARLLSDRNPEEREPPFALARSPLDPGGGPRAGHRSF